MFQLDVPFKSIPDQLPPGCRRLLVAELWLLVGALPALVKMFSMAYITEFSPKNRSTQPVEQKYWLHPIYNPRPFLDSKN